MEARGYCHLLRVAPVPFYAIEQSRINQLGDKSRSGSADAAHELGLLVARHRCQRSYKILTRLGCDWWVNRPIALKLAGLVANPTLLCLLPSLSD
jgi:hypothetical protein